VLRPDDREEEKKAIKVKHLHSPTINQESSLIPTRDESKTRRNNECQDLTTEKRREKQSRWNTCIVQPSTRNHRQRPLEMNPRREGTMSAKTRRQGRESSQDKTKHNPTLSLEFIAPWFDVDPSPRRNNDGKASTTRRGGQSRRCL
jgi:hypothetical protein